MKPKTVRDIAAIVRDRRNQLEWTQAQLASKVGVGREWVIEFEKGKPSIEWGNVLRALRELGLTMDLHPEDMELQKPKSDLDEILTSTIKQKRG